MADPDLQIRGERGVGACHPHPDISGGGGRGSVSKKKIFSALRASVWSTQKGEAGGGGGGGGRAWFATDL